VSWREQVGRDKRAAFRDDDYWVYDVRRRTHRPITAGVPTSFVNLDNDHTIEQKPPFGTGGWATGDEAVLLYDTGHIPGAVKVDWHMHLNDPVTRDYIDGTRFAELMASKGISRDSTVVFYGDNFNWWAAYALWVSTLFGHPDVRLLDGGRQADGRHRVPRRRLRQHRVVGELRQLLARRGDVPLPGDQHDPAGPGERHQAVHRALQQGAAGSGQVVQELGGRGTGERPQPGAGAPRRDDRVEAGNRLVGHVGGRGGTHGGMIVTPGPATTSRVWNQSRIARCRTGLPDLACHETTGGHYSDPERNPHRIRQRRLPPCPQHPLARCTAAVKACGRGSRIA
jgi:hypothetical protein